MSAWLNEYALNLLWQRVHMGVDVYVGCSVIVTIGI